MEAGMSALALLCTDTYRPVSPWEVHLGAEADAGMLGGAWLVHNGVPRQQRIAPGGVHHACTPLPQRAVQQGHTSLPDPASRARCWLPGLLLPYGVCGEYAYTHVCTCSLPYMQNGASQRTKRLGSGSQTE